MKLKVVASLLLGVGLVVVGAGAAPLTGSPICERAAWDLKTVFSPSRPRLIIYFENQGRDTMPAFGFQLRAYKWIASQKSYSTVYVVVDERGEEANKTFSVPRLACSREVHFEFYLSNLERLFWPNGRPPTAPNRYLLRIAYDRLIRDSDMSNHTQPYEITF